MPKVQDQNTKFWHALYWALFQWNYRHGTDPGQLFIAVAGTFSIFSIDNIVTTFAGNFWYQIQATYRRRSSQWNYHIKPIVERPLEEWDSVACSLCNTLGQLLVPYSGIRIFENPVLGTAPMELPFRNCPWPYRGSLHCHSFLKFVMVLQKLSVIFLPGFGGADCNSSFFGG